MGIRYHACDNPECHQTVCEEDPKIKNCEQCRGTFCGDYEDGGCFATVLLQCKDNLWCQPDKKDHENSPHMICIKCHEGSWPAERFNIWLLKRAGYTSQQDAKSAYDAFNETIDEEESSEASSEELSPELSEVSSDESSDRSLENNSQRG